MDVFFMFTPKHNFDAFLPLLGVNHFEFSVIIFIPSPVVSHDVFI